MTWHLTSAQAHVTLQNTNPFSKHRQTWVPTGFLHFSTWCDCRFLSPQFIPIHTNPIPITLMIILKSFMALHRGSFLSLISLSSTGRSTSVVTPVASAAFHLPHSVQQQCLLGRYTGCYCCWCRCSTLCFYRFSTDSLHPPRARWKPSCLYKWKHFFTFPRWIFPEHCSSYTSIHSSTHPSTTSPGSGYHRWVFSPSNAPTHSFTHSWWLAPNPLCTFHWPNANKLTWII